MEISGRGGGARNHTLTKKKKKTLKELKKNAQKRKESLSCWVNYKPIICAQRFKSPSYVTFHPNNHQIFHIYIP